LDLAKLHYGTVKRMAAFWAADIGCRCNNIRSAQIRSFKKIWLTCGAPNAIVVNVTKTDIKKKDRPMKVVEAVVQSGLPTVEDVRACLKSANMYLNPVVYDLLCSGIESGKLKNYPKAKQPSTLPRLVTIAHEAHIRLELFFSLEEQKFCHDPSTDHGLKRIRMWKKLLHRVKSDREKNGEQAELKRRACAPSSYDVNVGDDSDDDDEAPKKPRIDPMFY
jgi:hypothetical protein